MNAAMPAVTRRRTTLAAVALAAVVGVVSLIVATGRQADAMPPATAQPASPAPSAASATAVADASLATDVDAAAAPAATLPAGAVPTVGAMPAEPAAIDDPLAGVIVEPVDPAEALFGEQSSAVATSN